MNLIYIHSHKSWYYSEIKQVANRTASFLNCRMPRPGDFKIECEAVNDSIEELKP
jgi:hypothetical protein